RAEGRGRDPAHRLQALPRERGREERQGGGGRGADDRGRRLRIPDARSALVAATKTAGRRRNFWGWGYEHEILAPDELRAAAEGVRAHLGFGAGDVEQP